MKYYHMSDTLKIGDCLKLDYKEQMGLVIPFVQALEKSEDCFYALYLNAKYMRVVLGKFKLMDMCSLNWKWACEGIFEYVRKHDYPDCVSRMECNYFFDCIENARKLFYEDWGNASEEELAQIHLYEIELEHEPDKRDMLWFDKVFDALCDQDDYHRAIEYAHAYFQGIATEAPVWELLSNEKGIAYIDCTDE